MFVDKKTGEIKCFICNKMYGPDKTFLHVLHEGSVTCPENHVMGFEHDPEFKDMVED
jgi:hypothetical protein